jgi:hypothetical protein
MRTSIVLGAVAGTVAGAIAGYAAWVAWYELQSRRLEREMSGAGSYVPVAVALKRSAAQLAGQDPAGRQPKFLSQHERRP